jgi:hypothetical protein
MRRVTNAGLARERHTATTGSLQANPPLYKFDADIARYDEVANNAEKEDTLVGVQFLLLDSADLKRSIIQHCQTWPVMPVAVVELSCVPQMAPLLPPAIIDWSSVPTGAYLCCSRMFPSTFLTRRMLSPTTLLPKSHVFANVGPKPCVFFGNHTSKPWQRLFKTGALL